MGLNVQGMVQNRKLAKSLYDASFRLFRTQLESKCDWYGKKLIVADRFWGVDNMWTHAPIEDLMPFIKEMAQTLPPAPSHFLWLNWHPGNIKSDMAYSNEDKITKARLFIQLCTL